MENIITINSCLYEQRGKNNIAYHNNAEIVLVILNVIMYIITVLSK